MLAGSWAGLSSLVAQKIVQPKDRIKNSQPNYAKDYGPLGDCPERKGLNQYFDDLGRTIDQVHDKYGGGGGTSGTSSKQTQSNTNNNSINSDSNINLGNVSIADPGGTVVPNGGMVDEEEEEEEDGFQQCGACCCDYSAFGNLSPAPKFCYLTFSE